MDLIGLFPTNLYQICLHFFFPSDYLHVNHLLTYSVIILDSNDEQVLNNVT